MASDASMKLKERAATQSNSAMSLVDYLRSQKPRIAQALPQHLTPERLMNVVLTSIRTTPHLAECTPQSVMAAVMHCAALGLEPGPLGHAYLIPHFSSKKQAYEATFIMGYKGLIDLARRSGTIRAIAAREVYEADAFDLVYGTEDRLVHRPNFAKRSGRPILYYGVAQLTTGGYHIDVMSYDETEKIRMGSRSGDKGPWVTNDIEMRKKTVARRLCKYLPLSVEVQYGLLRDQDRVEAEDPAAAAILDEVMAEAPVLDSSADDRAHTVDQ